MEAGSGIMPALGAAGTGTEGTGYVYGRYQDAWYRQQAPAAPRHRRVRVPLSDGIAGNPAWTAGLSTTAPRPDRAEIYDPGGVAACGRAKTMGSLERPIHHPFSGNSLMADGNRASLVSQSLKMEIARQYELESNTLSL